MSNEWNMNVTDRMTELSDIQRARHDAEMELRDSYNVSVTNEDQTVRLGGIECKRGDRALDEKAAALGYVRVKLCGVCGKEDHLYFVAMVRPDTPEPQLTCHRCMGL